MNKIIMQSATADIMAFYRCNWLSFGRISVNGPVLASNQTCCTADEMLAVAPFLRNYSHSERV